MSDEPTDPIRLSEPGSEASVALRRLLTGAHGDQPGHAELAEVAARLGPILGSPSPSTAPPPAPSGGGGAGLALSGAAAKKLAVLALILGSGAVGTFALWPRSPDASRVRRRSSVSAAPSPPARAATPNTANEVPPPAPELAPPASPTVTPTADKPRPATHRRGAHHRKRHAVHEPSQETQPVAPSPPEAPAPETQLQGPELEALLVDRARARLTSDPREALAMVHQIEQQFPNGALVQERQVLAIDALMRLGRREEAQRLAQAFRQRFPNSAHRKRIDSILKRGDTRK